MTTTTAHLTAILSALDVLTIVNGECAKVQGQGHPGGTCAAALRVFLHTYAGGLCVVCEVATDLDAPRTDPCQAQAGHIVSAGKGRNGYVPGNLVNLCNSCNQAQGNKDLRPYLPLMRLDLIPLAFPTGWRNAVSVARIPEARRNERIAKGFDF